MEKRVFNRWFLLIWCGAFCLLLVQNVLCTGIPLFLQERGFSTAFSGLLGIPFALCGILGRVVGGRMMDRLSRRVVMALGCALMGIASLLFGLFPVAAAMLVLRCFHGAGFALGQAGFSTASVDVTPPEKSGLGVGVFWMSTALGTACAGILVQMIGAGGSYGGLFPACFAFGMAGCVLALLCGYERKKGAKEETGHGGEKEPLLEPRALRPALIEFFVMLGVSCPNIFILAYAAHQGYANASVFLLISACSMAAGNLSSAPLIRAVGPRDLLAGTMALSGALIAVIVLFPSPAAYYLGGVGFGMAQGFSFPILTALAVEGIPQERRGTANSTMLMAGDVGMGLGTSLWGAVIQAAGYFPAFLLAGASLILSGGLCLTFYRRHTAA